MFGVRYDFRFERALAGGMLLGLLFGLALARGGHRCTYNAERTQAEQARAEAIARAKEATARLDALEPRVRADELYRAKQFEAAANLIASVRPSDSDLMSLALQYQRLANNWRIGMDENAPVTDRFHALREAWKLDTVLGGAHSEELQKRLGDIALLAAPAFDRARDLENANLATHTADVLGR